MDFSPPDSAVHGIFQARIMEWVAITFSSGSSQPRDPTHVSWIAGRFSTIWTTSKVLLNQTLVRLFWTLFSTQPWLAPFLDKSALSSSSKNPAKSVRENFPPWIFYLLGYLIKFLIHCSPQPLISCTCLPSVRIASLSCNFLTMCWSIVD